MSKTDAATVIRKRARAGASNASPKRKAAPEIAAARIRKETSFMLIRVPAQYTPPREKLQDIAGRAENASDRRHDLTATSFGRAGRRRRWAPAANATRRKADY